MTANRLVAAKWFRKVNVLGRETYDHFVAWGLIALGIWILVLIARGEHMAYLGEVETGTRVGQVRSVVGTVRYGMGMAPV